ncbi:MAG TPA: M14 family metallopeptidase [Wenzhouxiangella sp.]|nr:M14 family metallopeptidase [Wenzhouxiangella sp.]
MTRITATLPLLWLPLAFGAVDSSCKFDYVTFSSGFEGARLSACRRLDKSSYELLIKPESAPINNSPWYAFRLDIEEGVPLRSLTLSLRYDDGSHRYQPKMLRHTDGRKSIWQALTNKQPESGSNGHSLSFELTPESHSLTISAQPLLTNADHHAFVQTMAEHADARLEVIGNSVEGRSIEALWIGQADPARPTVVLLGRQHPPEVPGALALQAFLREILADTERARSFRTMFQVLAIPNLNPDGVAHGHWRLNANHVDLNRDWGPFTQPATTTVGDLLKDLGSPRANGGLWLLLDFHSTRRDLFFTQREPPELDLPAFTRCWLDRVDQALPDYKVARAPRHLAEGTTAKAWTTRLLRAPAVTYEVGDATSPDTLARVARTAAVKLMHTLLQAHGQLLAPCHSACSPCVVPTD